MSIKITGLDDMIKKLDNLEKNAESLDGKHSVPFSELFHSKFMSNYTEFETIDAFVGDSGFDFSQLESIDENQLDEFVTKNTSFDSWRSMINKASEEWTAKKLGF